MLHGRAAPEGRTQSRLPAKNQERNDAMRWVFWRKAPRPVQLSAELRDALRVRFEVPAAEAGKLTCVEQHSIFAGRPVTRLRIYDSNLLNGDRSLIAKYDDLDAQEQAIVFEGHVEKDGGMDLIDRRPLSPLAPAA